MTLNDPKENKNNNDILFLESANSEFLQLKLLGEKTFIQLCDEKFFFRIDDESNSIAMIIRHLYFNMLQRWSNPFEDGFIQNFRNFTSEFSNDFCSRDELMGIWQEGWSCLFNTMGILTSEDLNRKIIIKDKEYFLIELINKKLSHYSYHLGQIIFLGKILVDHSWGSLSVPKDNKLIQNIFNYSLQEAENK